MSVPLSSHRSIHTAVTTGSRKAVIMQPYFLPYLGYFQLFAAADVIVVYDNVQYRKKSWINRNRLMLDNRVEYITVDLKKDSYQELIRHRQISPVYHEDRKRVLLERIRHSYKSAPFFPAVIPWLSDIILRDDKFLSEYICYSIKRILEQFEMNKEILLAPVLNIDPSCKASRRAVAICHALGADTYINPISGMGLYNDLDFSSAGIDLWFLRPEMPKHPPLKQSFEHPSIIDLFMHNEPEQIKASLQMATLHKKTSIREFSHV